MALTDLGVLFQIAALGESEHGVPLTEGGLHAGEWETSMMLAVHPELIKTEDGAPGFTGDMQAAVEGISQRRGEVDLRERRPRRPGAGVGRARPPLLGARGRAGARAGRRR